MQSRSLCCLTAGAHQRKPSLRLQLWPKCTTRRGPLETVLRVASKQSRKPKTDSYGWARIQVCFASMGSISNATILLPVRICGRGRLPAYSRHRMGGGGVQGTNRTPSKRTNPEVVPIHRYPSAVCTMAVGIPLNTPSCSRHDVCAYCDVRRTGS